MSDIEKARQVKLVKLPIHWKVDAVVMRGKRPIAWAEVKIRHAYHDQYPDIILSQKKVRAGLKLKAHLWGMEKKFTEAKPMQFLFLVRFVDGDYYADITGMGNYRVDSGGRTFIARDSQDIEQVVHIPIGEFKKLETK